MAEDMTKMKDAVKRASELNKKDMMSSTIIVMRWWEPAEYLLHNIMATS